MAGSTEITALRRHLARFSCLEVPPTLSPQERQTLREELLQFNQLSDYQTLGICVESLDKAQAALEAYVAALGGQCTLTLTADHAGPFYIKFNTLNDKGYVNRYDGPSRGVLITYHASEVDEVNGTYGPFPLDLFSGN
ncbi:hypothetical protein XM38_034820 [Halomicronema hongdechloris C2206]|uniref:DUF1824 domain-containing protein n=1 Tax=Halomicronema hongdechloris C2206 TaxID=1641165 RepID=A0A1Z3HQD2_9CYAN|nr:DUF1824 family protein [Halomicronema hongdechloris]ASC72524.1 hypothetical protein XM38_034820 [Halomicronema hongdechloris C2206]